MVLNTEWAQVEVIDLVNDGSGLAFGIIGGRSTGVVVKTILPGGVADRLYWSYIVQDGRLQSGDHILQIGDVSLRGLGSEQAASVLRQCGVHVRMVVARPVEPTAADYQALGSNAPIVPTRLLGDPDELGRHLVQSGYPDTLCPATPATYLYTKHHHSQLDLQRISGIVDVVRNNPLPIGKVPIVVNPPSEPILPLPEMETYMVQLQRDELGLGITVAGYVCEKEELSGIFVKSISPGSAAYQSGKIHVNDRIVEVDGVSVIGCTNHSAVERLRQTGATVNLKLERYLRGPKFEQLQEAIKANELRPPSPPSPSLSSLPKFPISQMQLTTSAVEPEGESRTSIDFDSAVLLEDEETPPNEDKEIVFDDVFSSTLKQVHDTIKSKWKNVLGDEVDIVVAQLRKDANGGLGISLEGTVDVEDGVEVRPHHYIRSVLPDGPVGRNGLLQAGDELLEVNTIRLLGLNHLEVVGILKKLPSSVCLVCGRCEETSGGRTVINTAQHKEAFAARNILAGSLRSLLPSSERLVKAKSDSSLASSPVGVASPCSGSRSRSRSLELGGGLAMWSEESTQIDLIKADRGLGFSILDYQDPLEPKETVIVVRSLVPGGAAQRDGRLAPGDRLVAVNGEDLSRASLDQAVRALKGAPRGLVNISVAKPLSAHDTLSHSSQVSSLSFQECMSDASEEHTCVEDFHECIEEYRECLEVRHICFNDEDTPTNRTPNTSNEHLNGSPLQPELSQQQVDNNNIFAAPSSETAHKKQLLESQLNFSNNNNDAVISRLSDETSDKDGYETCLEETLSEDWKRAKETAQSGLVSSSEPCISSFLSPTDDELKSYDEQTDSFGGDQFFLVEYIDQDIAEDGHKDAKWASEPTVVDPRLSLDSKTIFYRKCLVEYYNDYAECIEQYRKYADSENARSQETVVENVRGEEMDDEDIFRNIVVHIRWKSAPEALDSMCGADGYDIGPEVVALRRKSAFLPGYQPEEFSHVPVSMTVTQPTVRSSQQQTIDMLDKHWGRTRSVTVHREPGTSLGISIVGGKVDLFKSDTESETVLGIFIKNVVPESPAGKTGQLKTGDRILEVSGTNLRQASHEAAVEVIRNAPDPVTFLVQSLIPWTPNESSTVGSHDLPQSPFPSPTSSISPDPNADGSKRPSITVSAASPVATSPEKEIDYVPKQEVVQHNHVEPESSGKISEPSSEESDEDEEDTRELEGRTATKKGQEIDRASAGNVKMTKEEMQNDTEEEDDFGYTMNKVKKKYASLGHSVVMVQLERGGAGLGLSLAGHKDRNCMAVFVCGLNPAGAAFRTGAIQVGDEILEVNGVVLHGRCHLNASAIIKGLSGPIFKVIILRRKTALDDIAVKPITQFPVTLEEESPEEKYSNYPNVRIITIKKGTHSLGIMIIEGRHAEVGQGIFISDIQEGSAAEKAGLDIGEMILAVNKDSLLESNYDSAANLLKRTEGLVTLVVCNPNKRTPSPAPNLAVGDVDKIHATPQKSSLAPSAPHSRPATPEPPPDPLTCSIAAGKETAIEILTDNKGLGVYAVGGKDTLIPNGIVILEVLPGGPADKDKRLQPGDQILEANGISCKDVSSSSAQAAIRQPTAKARLNVFRPDKVETTMVDVDLMKKPGKGLGLSVIAKKTGTGVYIAEILNGGVADVDGRLMKGDVLTAVNGQSIDNMSGEKAAAVLKTAIGKVNLKLCRYKPQPR